MKADWDKLGKKYASSESVLIVDADCTAAAQGTCGQQGVKGYPTIKYYMAGSKAGRDYQQGRDFNSLDNFVKQTLDKEMCDVSTGKGCKPIQQKFIDANKQKSRSELETMAKERKDSFKEQSKEFKAQEKEFKKNKKKYEMASQLLKKMIKKAPKDEL
jgi:hypothetical protein